VWRLDDARALVVTADFITPVVDDARTWGRVAAANAVSDVYAMGGAPLLALNLVSWPRDELPLDLLGDVIAGAQDIAAEGAFALVGGHSVDDPEPKFGLAVVGLAHPDRLLRNSGLRPGDVLVLSKAVGVGVITTGIKVERAGADAVEAALASMTKLNAEASRIALARGATGATDVTGFGLLGHLGRAALESGVDVVIETATVPVLPGARELAEQNVVPGGTGRNRAWIADVLDDHDVDDTTVTLLADAQTSGGLVFGVSADEADGAVADLRASGHEAAAVGRVEAGSGRIRLL
jgi:selenide, water dikinase